MFPGIEQLGFGALAGAVAGYAAKKIAKLTAIFLGILFILLQLLAYHHLVEIRWGEVGDAARGLTDSGAPDSLLSSFMKVLTHNIPFGASFGVGFWIGFKKG